MKTLITSIPFSGFYESDHNAMIDQDIEQYFQYDGQGNSNIPNEFYDKFDHSAVYHDYARRYALEFIDKIKENNVPTDGMEFEKMVSPKEYNFTTDRLFCFVPEETVKAWYKISRSEKHKTLDKVIKENFTSRDGFASFYKNDVNDWIIKPVTDWDHNEIGTLLIAVMEIQGIPENDDCFRAYDLMDSARGNGFISGLIEQAMPAELAKFADKQREAGKALTFKEKEIT